MEFTGRISGVSKAWRSKGYQVEFLINEEPNGIDELNDKDLKITVTKKTNPRSLNANAYFHVLCDKLRQKLGVSMAAMKNELITSYGQIDYLEDGQSIIYKTNVPPERIREFEEIHMQYFRRSEDGGYWYRVYRGSHTYDTKEMSKLLDGTIAEAKEQGIETRTPDEIARSLALWEQERGKHD